MHNSGNDPLTQLQQDTKGNVMDIFLLLGLQIQKLVTVQGHELTL